MSAAGAQDVELDREARIAAKNMKQEEHGVQESTILPQEDAALREAQEAAGTLAFLASGASQDHLTSHSVYQQTSLPYIGLPSARDPPSSRDVLEHQESPQNIKKGSPQPATPTVSNQPENAELDAETAKAIAAAQNEYNTRVRGPKKQPENMIPITQVDMSEPAATEIASPAAMASAPVPAPGSASTPTPSNSAPTTTKKRPAPKSAATNKFHPSSTKKPPPKKRKVDSSEDRTTPTSSQQSPAPSANLKASAKTTPAAKGKKNSLFASTKAESPAIPGSPSGASDISDDQVYCICRKPDDHSWMIGCDGGCDDWYHGKCVDMRKEDENLIDKFICPICVEKGMGITTWKPMCRREGCRKPARLRKGEESKYCSSNCGVQFMSTTVKRASAEADAAGSLKRNKTVYPEPGAHEPSQANIDADIGPMGGRIRIHELKSLVHFAPSAEDFRRLGSAPLLTPPQSLSPDAYRAGQQDANEAPGPDYSEQDIQRLSEIEDRKQELKQRRQLLKDRGQLLNMMKSQRDKTAERLKVKDVCGFDSRWSMDDVAFKTWRESEDGSAAFEKESLDAANRDLENAADADNDSTMANDTTLATPSGVDAGSYICVKKRCERHRQWQKLALQDIRFEEADVSNNMRRIDAEEKEIKQRAIQRGRGLEHGSAQAKQSSEGWVEIVQDEDSLEDIVGKPNDARPDSLDVKTEES